MELSKIQNAITALDTTLREEQAILPKLKLELTQRLCSLALQGLSCEDVSLDEIRAAIEHAERSTREIPPAIGLLEIQESALREQAAAGDHQTNKLESDQKFFDLLNQIIATGAATPAELATLCRYAGSSSNPARRWDVERLTEALEDHNRRVKSARSRHQEPPVFIFDLEENGGK